MFISHVWHRNYNSTIIVVVDNYSYCMISVQDVDSLSKVSSLYSADLTWKFIKLCINGNFPRYVSIILQRPSIDLCCLCLIPPDLHIPITLSYSSSLPICSFSHFYKD